ncbi:helix-turn-helix domain-containing protein [Mycobacteroides abscessus]|uniref:helix-turn-helix domain-containing protein n=1 Tax=Mycobacteroides abscessus TaxID=36809 RepID=UPI0019D15F5A|nr:helix-turn-helix domain-containing protein [Mycobacteroides abscessus]MBN7457560.1 helix-turn-helix domain-containing protein [Mycobacteroides abscessus subsp. abscessus]
MAPAPSPVIGDTWLTTTDAVERYGIERGTLHHWARSGTGPIRRRRVGRLWVWLRADLDTLLAVN